ncbi:MAG: ester cyclase [Haloarculaceae archaeon]
MAELGLDPHLGRLIEAFNDHDIDRYIDQYSEDLVFRDPLTDEATREELREEVLELFEGFPDARIEPDSAVSSGDETALEMAFVGTHEGPYKGIPPTGEHAEVPAVMVTRIAEDGISYRRDYWDLQGYKEELGLTFPAVLRRVPRFAVWTLEERLSGF